MPTDFSSMTVAALTTLAKENGVRGYSGKNKAQLIALLSSNAPAPAKVTQYPMEEGMTLSALIGRLTNILAEQGDMKVCIEAEHTHHEFAGVEVAVGEKGAWMCFSDYLSPQTPSIE